MQLKKYTVSDMREAIKKIKDDLGSGAIIVSTRRIKKGGGAFGMFGKEMLEVTAASGQAAQAQARIHARSRPQPATASGLNDYKSELAYNAPQRPRSLRPAEQEGLMAPFQRDISEMKDIVHEIRRGYRKDANDGASVTHMRHEIREMKSLINTLVSQSGALQDKDLHENLISLKQELIFNGVEEKFARRLLEEVHRKIPADEIDNFSYVKLYVARMFMQVLKIDEDPIAKKEKGAGPSIISLIGPTGVGKTTTAAKIASIAKLADPDKKIGLITIDTFRIAGVQQLQEYARIIKLPVRVVSDKEQLDDSLEEFKGKDLILIDSAGRSQRDELQMSEMRELLNTYPNFKNLLVISATTKDSDLTEITKRFGAVDLAGVIFTKLDESTTYGSVFNHAIRFKLPLTYLTIGQNVPDDIEKASKERMIDLLLGISGES